ncbi:uncharacterized protein LOC143153902 [Ptiloglossa arizonensis]|uniref:uncharacterized protein LOC143153902 n=1 Tax=Ptiloglossa arizonensis TaxID=3350558 RepID=UPI003FA07EF0
MPDVQQGKDNVEDRLASLKQSSRSRVCQEHGEEDCPSENEHEFESLEYEEDVYYSNLTATPSFDDIDELSDDADEIVVHCWRDSNGEIDEIVVDDANLSVETQFFTPDDEDAETSHGRKKKRSVRVIFQDFSKPYLARISNSQNYKKFLELVKGAQCNTGIRESPVLLSISITFIAVQVTRTEKENYYKFSSNEHRSM